MTTPEKHANITVSVTPDGLHIRCEYTGPIASIPAAVERLRAAGVLDLVAQSRPAALQGGNSQNEKKPQAPRVAPAYNGAGEACCPVHNRKLSDGQYGAYCSAKATGDQVADKRGYCGLKFQD